MVISTHGGDAQDLGNRREGWEGVMDSVFLAEYPHAIE